VLNETFWVVLWVFNINKNLDVSSFWSGLIDDVRMYDQVAIELMMPKPVE